MNGTSRQKVDALAVFDAMDAVCRSEGIGPSDADVAAARAAIVALSQPTAGGEACPNCQGHGMIGWVTGQTPEQFEQHEAPCPDCNGTGSIGTAPVVAGEAVRGLPAKWRDLGARMRNVYERLRESDPSTLDDCADELEEALAAPASAAKGGG